LKLFNTTVILAIITFLVLAILGETTNVRLYSGLLTAVSATALTLVIVKHQKLAFPKNASLFFLLFLGWMLISSFFSKDIGQTIWEVLRTASYFSLFLVVYNLTRRNQQIQNFLLILFVSFGGVIMFKDLYIFLLGKQLASGVQFAGAFLWHNQMAGFLLFLIPIVFQLFLNLSNRPIKYALLFLLTLFFFALILTSSRGGWLSMGGGLLFFTLLNLKKIRAHFKPLFVMIMALALTFPLIVQSPTIIQKTKSIKEDVKSETRTVSGNLRVTAWQNSIRMIKDYPFFGVGPGAFGSAYYAYQTDPWLYSRYAHNHLLHIASELGIPGFFFFSAILVTALVLGVRERRRLLDEKRNPLLPGIAAGLFASTLHAFLDFDWSTITLFSIFWIFISIFFAALTRKENIIEISGVKKIFYLLPLFLLIVSLVLIFAEKQYKRAQMFIGKEDFKSSEKSVNKAIKFNPFDAEYYLFLGELRAHQNREDQAKASYQKAISLSPLNSEIFYRIGILEFGKENYKEAKKWFAKAVKLNPYSHPKLYDGLSDSYLKLGDTKTARKTLKAAVDIAFPLNESFKGFEYLYDYTGFKKELAGTYIRLITLDIMLGEKEEAKRLLSVVEKDLDPKNITLPILKKIL
jgi:putative inorganic carbon (HCO3(-)) transporter